MSVVRQFNCIGTQLINLSLLDIERLKQISLRNPEIAISIDDHEKIFHGGEEYIKI